MRVMPPPVDHDAPLKALLWGLSIPLNVIIAENMLSLRHSWLRRQALRVRASADAQPDMSSCTLNPHLYTTPARQQSLREYVGRLRDLYTEKRGSAPGVPDTDLTDVAADVSTHMHELEDAVVKAFYRCDTPEACYDHLLTEIEAAQTRTALDKAMLWRHVCFSDSNAYSGVIPDDVA